MSADQAQTARGRDVLTPYEDPSAVEGWWNHYIRTVGLPHTAKQVLDVDCGYVVERCLLGVDERDLPRWPASRVRKGLVMGSVQSGKTASMIGVVAKALDAGVDMVVVLSGTRVALWQQTFQRLADQLDLPGASVELLNRRVWIPGPDHGADPLADLHLARTYTMGPSRMARVVRDRIPLVVVAMKQPDHLARLSKEMREGLFPAVAKAGRPFHVLVLDDEADDGSVIDARAEEQPRAGQLKQVPRYIVDLWDSRPHSGATALPELHATYVAYTATPQANFLQSSMNPLAPTDFVVSLRVPAQHGSLAVREPTYAEPVPLKGWYTGGDFFYKRLEDAPLCVPTDELSDPLDDALKAFLVGATVRLWREPERLGPVEASTRRFGSLAEAQSRCMRPSSMLIHPSAAKNDHFSLAAQVLAWSMGADVVEGEAAYARGTRTLATARIERSLETEPEAWQQWLDSYGRTAVALARECAPLRPRHIPGAEAWEDFKMLLLEQVLPAVHVAVINSDERADDRPRFEPVQEGSDWRAAPDSMTIFVSGSVMSRGLTLEGLLSTYFSRRAGQPLADTQMQMQRWFGYRGGYLELCRVFLSAEQQDLFTAYHEADEALRREVLALMNAPDAPPTPLVLQGRYFAATGKIAGVQSKPLCPGPHPFFTRLASAGAGSLLGEELVRLAHGGVRTVGSGGDVRGLLFDETLDLQSAADLIDAMRFPDYVPGRGSWEARRWVALQRSIGLVETDSEHPLYRPPAPGDGGDPVERDCPYSTAAYLRLWDTCLSRNVPGLYPTDDARTPWSLLDLDRKLAQQPRFRVALRTGAGSPVAGGPLLDLPVPVRATERTPRAGFISSRWGSHNPSAAVATGDEYFDLLAMGTPLPAGSSGERVWRPVGTDGMLLFHLVDIGGGEPALALGASIPLGGPDHFAAQVDEASGN